MYLRCPSAGEWVNPWQHIFCSESEHACVSKGQVNRPDMKLDMCFHVCDYQELTYVTPNRRECCGRPRGWMSEDSLACQSLPPTLYERWLSSCVLLSTPGSLAHRLSGIVLPLTPISPQKRPRTHLTLVCIMYRIMGLSV